MLEIKNATKKFGEQVVLNNVNLKMEQGKIYGLVGRNGSGKTVLFKSICGFINLDEGQIIVNNKQIGKDIEMPSNIGILIETPGFLPGYSGFRNLKFLASIKNKITDEEIRKTMDLVGLDPCLKKAVSKYSLGMKQRLGIAQAIMEKPDILLLDEPMNSLDESGVEEMRHIFNSLKEEGKMILIASHNMDDVRYLCDEVYKIDAGKLKPFNFSFS